MTGHDVVPASSFAVCPRCAHDSPCPAAAAVVECNSCHLYFDGPAAADPGLRDHLRTAQDRHARQLQATLQAAKDRAARRRGLLVDEDLVDVEVVRPAAAPSDTAPLDPELLPSVVEAVEEDEDLVDAELLSAEEGQGAGTDVAEAGLDAASAAVLAALDAGARQHLDDVRPEKTKAAYARDWALWREYLDWLATPERAGHRLPDTAVSVGTLVGFVTWLDAVLEAAPASIDRRITGVTVEARRRGAEVPKDATVAARQALKPIKLDKVKAARGRGKAKALTPEHLRTMATASPVVPAAPGSSRGDYEVPELARLRDAALHAVGFAVAGRNEELSVQDDTDFVLVPEGLEVTVPSVKGRPARTVAVAYGQHPETCPVRRWEAWKAAKEEAGVAPGGAAWLAVDRWGHLGSRMGPDACRQALTRSGERAGLPVRVTGHSRRRGIVTTGRRHGKRAEKLRAQGGWAANSPVFWGYIDEGELWEDAATEGIGL
ncbi:hypothetical protein [Kitasatospora sp. CB02891]|uniref:hypothetical protein n=1 Tax=Kitasatospora sp. CB02891 TaxID=2020329 RepID=UPI000C270417|nr:hypothetical protein [Kitasatospora sp. CB02891]PJN21127.1 hypothetical protein CG736_34865 [Kitasatospora sp. CB02891]